MAHGQTRLFIKQLLTRPGSTGSLIPSSNELAKRMIELAAPPADAVIVEFGPGTGVFTKHILDELLPDQRFFAIELNESFARELRRCFPSLHLHIGCASELGNCCRGEGVDRVDCVISGLPWAVFSEELQSKILNAMLEVMPKGGIFVTFAYLQGLLMPAGRRFKKNLKKCFSKIAASGVVWKNIPPAIIYRCEK
ncbi:MAG: ribosomal RNA adenine dimethylase domain-containing protein [Planctomycetes bacterium]|nr:ribosomal RNA adenine dimethylase domain-containing protein [Planctomycetota bacterium]